MNLRYPIRMGEKLIEMTVSSFFDGVEKLAVGEKNTLPGVTPIKYLKINDDQTEEENDADS